jgi:preprotein translocase subunit YajC
VSGQLLFLLVIGAVFYLLILAPQRRKLRQQQEMAARLEPGVEIMTTAGLFATVREVTDDEVHLEVAPGVVQRYAKGAIARVITPPEPEPEQDATPDGDGTSEPGSGSTDGPAAPREP